MSDKTSSIRILDDAKRLNMMDGHFVWLWIDTDAVINVKNTTDEIADEVLKRSEYEELRFRRNAETNTISKHLNFEKNLKWNSENGRKMKRAVSNDINELKINYLLQNDQYLLFNRNYGVESSKLRDRRSDAKKQQKKEDYVNTGKVNRNLEELPAGLLSLKPLPVKIDKHLVKGAVRLLVSVLKDVLNRSPSWMLENLVTMKNNGCWKNNVIKESSFITDFGR